MKYKKDIVYPKGSAATVKIRYTNRHFPALLRSDTRYSTILVLDKILRRGGRMMGMYRHGNKLQYEHTVTINDMQELLYYYTPIKITTAELSALLKRVL